MAYQQTTKEETQFIEPKAELKEETSDEDRSKPAEHIEEEDIEPKNPEQTSKKKADRTTGDGEPLAKKAKPAIEETVTAEKEEHQSRYYRLLRDDEHPGKDGIQAKNAYAQVNLTDHIEKGSYNASQYISLSETSNSVIEWGQNNIRKGFSNQMRIAVIDAVRLAKTDGIKIYDCNWLRWNLTREKAIQFANKDNEVVVEGNIGLECIVQVITVPFDPLRKQFSKAVSEYVKKGFENESVKRITVISDKIDFL